MTIRPLYVSPIGRGGVDIGIQNILRAVQRAGLSDAALLRMPERYNSCRCSCKRPCHTSGGMDVLSFKHVHGLRLHSNVPGYH